MLPCRTETSTRLLTRPQSLLTPIVSMKLAEALASQLPGPRFCRPEGLRALVFKVLLSLHVFSQQLKRCHQYNWSTDRPWVCKNGCALVKNTEDTFPEPLAR